MTREKKYPVPPLDSHEIAEEGEREIAVLISGQIVEAARPPGKSKRSIANNCGVEWRAKDKR